MISLVVLAATALLSSTAAAASAATPCLCIFDIDRTMTGRQDDVKDCPANAVHKGVPDCGYAGGDLTLSALAQGVNETFCASCFIGVVSAGTGCGAGSPERALLVESLNTTGMLLSSTWSAPRTVTSPLVTSWQDGLKQDAVKQVAAWYAQRGHTVASADVHMFDDRVSNIAPFKGTGFSAHQISCATRDPEHQNEIGLCGATLKEIVPTVGVHLCDDDGDDE